ncbi:MAG TPA: hypothetical protein VIL29_12430, partial [Pseudothermotoga sp.]
HTHNSNTSLSSEDHSLLLTGDVDNSLEKFIISQVNQSTKEDGTTEFHINWHRIQLEILHLYINTKPKLDYMFLSKQFPFKLEASESGGG